MSTFENFPEIPLAGLDSLKVEQPETSIRESDIDGMLENLRRQRSTFQAVERKAADGDQVTIDFKATIKGEPFDGGEANDARFVIGAGQMPPDFERGLIGMSAGGDKVVRVKFPLDYHEDSVAGTRADFAVRVTEVAAAELPKLDEEFVKTFGIESGDLAELRDEIRANMARELTAKINDIVKTQLTDQLLASNPVDIPEGLVDQECLTIQQETMRGMGITDPTQAPPADSFRDAAQSRVRLRLLITAVIRAGGIELNQGRVKEKVEELCAAYEQPEETRKMYFQNPQLLGSVESMVIEEQAIDWLLSKSEVKTKATAFNDLMNA